MPAARDAADVAPGRYALLAVFIGGMAGTAVRLGFGEVADAAIGATLAANLIGAFLLGFLFERLREHRLRRGTAWSALGPGFAGALTTFSTLQLEAVGLLEDGAWKTAALYLGASIFLGIPLAALGRYVGGRWA